MGGSVSKQDPEPHIEGRGGGNRFSSVPGSPSGGGAGGPRGVVGVIAGGGSVAGNFSKRDVVPTVFRWTEGGEEVYLTGTFAENWRARYPMHRSGNDFTYVAHLARGKHLYKFVVDGHWRFASDQETEIDEERNINNVIDVSNFYPDDEVAVEHSASDPSTYTRGALPSEGISKDPPPLPPQLRRILLNQPELDGPSAHPQLAVPLPVTIDHLCCTGVRDGLVAQALTSRYRSKYTTVVYYSVFPESSAAADQQQVAQAAPAPSAAAAAGVDPSVLLTAEEQASIHARLQRHLAGATEQVFSEHLGRAHRDGQVLGPGEQTALREHSRLQAHELLLNHSEEYAELHSRLRRAQEAAARIQDATSAPSSAAAAAEE